DLVITLLGSLNESYQFLITALESRADTLTWELVAARLMHEDMKRKEQHGEGAASEQAFVSNAMRKGHPAKKTGACRHCSKQGHWIAECPLRNQENINGDRRRHVQAHLARDDTRVVESDNDYLFMTNGSVAGGSASASVRLADDGIVEAIGCGDVEMAMQTAQGLRKGMLTDGSKWTIGKSFGKGLLDMIVKNKLGTGIDIASVSKWELCDGDVCGPMQTPTFGGKRFFVTFIDAKFMEDEFDDGRRVGAQGAVIHFVDDDTDEENDYHEECDEYEESGGRKAIGCKWVFKFTSIRVVLALAAMHGLMLHQMDVKTAFLNGDLDEVIDMMQPEGYGDTARPTDFVCKHDETMHGVPCRSAVGCLTYL
ncbi:hypothetical protein PybrP1_002784, partial [[Pythium] brassicae (nom. inval.)]